MVWAYKLTSHGYYSDRIRDDCVLPAAGEPFLSVSTLSASATSAAAEHVFRWTWLGSSRDHTMQMYRMSFRK